MFTIMIRHLVSGREYLTTCEAVEWEKDKEAPNSGLLLVRKDGTSVHYGPSDISDDRREVFVMNDAGQTVARYLL